MSDKSELIEKIQLSLECFEREDNLRHQRLSWALQMNIAIIGAIFLSHSQDVKFASEVQTLGASLGFCFTIISLLGILAADKQFNYLREYLRKQTNEKAMTGDDGFEKHGLPRPYGENQLLAIGGYAPRFYCIAIAVIWVLVFINGVHGWRLT